MDQVLIVQSSPRKDSLSRKLAAKVEAQIAQRYPNATIVHRELDRGPLPHLDEAAIAAMMSRGADPAQASALALSDMLIDELVAADVLVIAYPMWNFSIPSSLKAWIDHVVRGGRTFNYTPEGPVGHLAGKKAILVASAVGTYSDGPMKSWDFAEPYMKLILNFIGITDIEVVRVEGQLDGQGQFDPASVANAETAVEALAA